MLTATHEEYMGMALGLARRAAGLGEAPVGCVVVDGSGRVIGRGRNTRERDRSALGHAELTAIGEACRVRGDWRLGDCALYVTLEPCPMCAGAIIAARLQRLYYGAREALSGSCGSVINLFMENYGHSPQITGGLLEAECAALMTDFFRKLRGR